MTAMCVQRTILRMRMGAQGAMERKLGGGKGGLRGVQRGVAAGIAASS